MDGLDLCTAALHAEEVEAHRARFRALGPDAMPSRLLGILWHQTLQFCFGLFMFEVRRTGPRENRSELRPGIGGAHVDDADGLDSWLWRLDPEQPRWLAALDAAPELALRRDDEMLVERIGVGHDLYPLAAPSNDREHRLSGRDHPHVMLQL